MTRTDWEDTNSKYVRPALSAWRAGRIEEGEGIFEEGLTATGNDGFVALNYGECLEAAWRFEEAKAMLELALRKLPLPKYRQRAQEALDRVTRSLAANKPSETIPERDKTAGTRIGLISCTKSKKDYVCTARELYSESPDFKWWLGFAEQNYARAYVVSAKHGLVELSQILCPYDRRLDDYNEREREAWALFIAARLRLDGMTTEHTVYITASEKYATPLSGALQEYGVKTVVFPLERRPTPDQLR
jgi:tetratricopeptide (TPR) repeat protein